MKTPTNSLIKLDNATKMLAEIRSIDDAKNLIDLAEAARVYAKQVELGLQAQNYAAEIKLRAQRRAGEILDTLEGQQGKRTDITLLHHGAKSKRDIYSDAGIAPVDAHRWQTIAKMPEETFEQFIEQVKIDRGELTTAGIYREARFEIGKLDKFEPPPLEGKYRVIYADPPWKYGDPMGIAGYKVSAEMRYPVMSIEELCALPIIDLAEDNSVLFMWVTSPMLEECFKVINAWGFKYKTSFVWDKIKHNFGHYNSVRHEFLLLATRGSCTPDIKDLFDSVQVIERNNHNEKPEAFRTIVDRLYPRGNRIELFARQLIKGWEQWGNEPINIIAESP